MSSFPPFEPPPLEYSPDRRRPVWPTVLAWLAIVACVAFILVGQYFPEIRGRKRAASSGPMQEAQLELVARYAVGANQVLHGMGSAATTQKDSAATSPSRTDPAAQIADMLGKQAKGPLDEFHSAIAAGELLGNQTALTQLDAIHVDSDVPKPDQEDIDLAREIYTNGADKLSADARSRLIERHQFFGKLALSFGQPETDPIRAEVLAKSEMTFIGVIGFFMLMSVLLLAGIVLLIITIVMFASHKMTPVGTAPEVPGGPFVEAFALYLLTYIGISVVLAMLKMQTLSASLALVVLMPLALIWPIVRGLPAADCRRALGWNTGTGLFREIGWGLLGYVAGIPVVALGFVCTFILMKLANVQPSHPLVGEIGKISPLVIYGLACVVAPLLEETMFRGALLHHLRTRWSWLPSALLVSLIFAAIHPQGLTFIPTLGAIAMVLAALREWRGSLVAPMVAHATTNFVTTTLLMFALR